MELICTTCQSCVCCPVVHTHCWEPSLVFLPNLTNRLFGEAAGKVGGLGGRERNSSEESFIWFIPVCSTCVFLLELNRCRHVEFNTEASSIVSHRSVLHAECFASFLGCFIQDKRHKVKLQFTHSGTGAADVSSPRPAVGICCKRAAQSSGDGSGFSFVSHRWIKSDWLITGQKIDRSERCFYLCCALPDGAAESGRTRSPDVLRFDSANSWRRQEVHTPAHPCWNFQNKTSEKRASRIFLFRFKASHLKFRQCPRWGRFGEFVDETVLVWTNKTRMNHGTKHCCVHDSIFWAQITTGITGLISVT